ncbi:OOP family OmpA-OmpF porin [Dokdonella fugitiva]|uniref:OOP family OmpA-OmpF porin n=1 Tax=Dokdonella fugitiva TaxID=328517 RepID=A0A839FCJ7_9GAMM|nr:outer membrane beta-barrel protein [Dokdonella fugitiva]MBA8889794.1 OOP family OmpA-OmpF porin [Dokdonella fugitiva]
MTIRIARFAFPTLALLASAGAHAQAYVGASVGRSSIDIDRAARSDAFLDLGFDGAHTTVDDADTAYRVYGGYFFLPYVGMELAYVDLGRFSFRTDVQPTGSLVGRTRIHGGEASIVGRLPIGDAFAVYARAGAYAARVRTRYSGSGSVTVIDGAEQQAKRTTKAAYAIGAIYAFNPHWIARVEWARYDGLGDELTGGSTDANIASVGVAYAF